jgi:hypothetical protein
MLDDFPQQGLFAVVRTGVVVKSTDGIISPRCRKKSLPCTSKPLLDVKV